jgi:hypothetical protein
MLRDSGGSWGLPHVFLSRLAQGYIGTLGVVDQEIAADLGAQIISVIKEAGTAVRLPKILRDIRLRELGGRGLAALRTSDDATLARLLFAFMYVYFGQPCAELKVGEPASDGPRQ